MFQIADIIYTTDSTWYKQLYQYAYNVYLLLISVCDNVMLYWCHWCYLDRYTIFDKFCSKWTSHYISHFRLCLLCNISL